MNESKFEAWAIVELFGRQIVAGRVSEQLIAGQGFVRVSVPAIDGQEAYTKLYGPNAIYCITPTDEATACEAVTGLRPKAIEVWKLNLPRLSAPREEGDHDLDERYDDDSYDF
jgi:hypothetical protein